MKLEAIGDLDTTEDFPAIAARQEAELRRELRPDAPGTTVSFFGLCDEPPGGAEAAAARFLGLLSLHADGAVTLVQEEPYGDIAVGCGPAWPANWLAAA